MSWTNDREVATVERGDLGLPQHLGRGDHRGVDEAQRKVAVSVEQLSRTHQPVRRQIDELERARVEVPEQRGECSRPWPHQILHLYEHADRDDARLHRSLERLRAT